MARGNSIVSNNSNVSGYTDGSLEDENCYSPVTAFSSVPSPGGYTDQDFRAPLYLQQTPQSPNQYQSENTAPYRYNRSESITGYEDQRQSTISNSQVPTKLDFQNQEEAEISHEDDFDEFLITNPFDPRDGDPNIHGSLYYDFMVTRTEAFWQLKPGYRPSEEYPEKRPDAKMVDE